MKANLEEHQKSASREGGGILPPSLAEKNKKREHPKFLVTEMQSDCLLLLLAQSKEKSKTECLEWRV